MKRTTVVILVMVGVVAGLAGLAATAGYGKSQVTYKLTLLQGVRGDDRLA